MGAPVKPLATQAMLPVGPRPARTVVEIVRGLAETVWKALQLPEVLSIPMIESPRNKRFKLWRRCVEQPEREDCPWIAVEGWKAISDLAAERSLELLVLADSGGGGRRVDGLIGRAKSCFSVPDKLFRQLSTVAAPQGALAFFAKPRWTWEDLPPCALYLDQLRDPGNLGTLMRTARATGSGILAGPGTVSCCNSKAVRASAAALFSAPFLESVPLHQLSEQNRRLVAAALDGGESLFEADLSPPLAVAVGNEGAGVSPETVEAADALIHIPMLAGADSLNAAVAGSLILYEVFRRGLRPS